MSTTRQGAFIAAVRRRLGLSEAATPAAILAAFDDVMKRKRAAATTHVVDTREAPDDAYPAHWKR